MAIVATYWHGNTRVDINDDAYRDVPQEEIDRRIQHMKDVAGAILYRQQLRELGKEKTNAG